MKTFIIFILFLTLSGCSYIHDRSDEYQGSPCLAPLTVPPELHSSQIGDDLTIPNLRRATRNKASLLPPDSLASQVAEGKLSKKALKKRERESRLTQITWTQDKYGAPALMISEGLVDTINHLERALKTLTTSYRIKTKDAALATFYIYDLPAMNGKLMANTPVYQLRLIELENGTMITLAADEDQIPPNTQITQHILTKVYEALDDTKEGLSLKQWLFN
jgi:uncharacterized lipoprotein